MMRIDKHLKNFGGVHAVNNASLQISEGAITGLIGPNGAGKSTLFNCVAGLHKPTSGRILLDGEDISGLEPHLLFEKGVLRTFQLAHEFKSLTVRENLMVVPHNQAGENLIKVWFSRKLVKESEKKVSKKADEVIEFLEISSLANELAGNLSGGQKKLLELGRTMMVEPKIVFLDEVGAGVNRTLLNKIADCILRLNTQFGYTFCLIEHDMDFVSRLCDPVICMAEGAVLAEGTIGEIKNNERVIEAYLGTKRSQEKD